MLILSGTFTIKPEKIDEFKSAAITMQTASQAEEGCLVFRVYQDLEDETVFRLYEKWETEEAHEAHHKTEHYYAIIKILPNLVASSSGVKTYEVIKVSE